MPEAGIHRRGRSESATLGIVLYKLNEVHDALEGELRSTGERLRAIHTLQQAVHLLREMERQVQKGIHVNPPLVIYGNPPRQPYRERSGEMSGGVGQVMSEDVHAVYYKHVNGGLFVHEFEGPVAMLAQRTSFGRHDVHLYHLDGKPLWNVF